MQLRWKAAFRYQCKILCSFLDSGQSQKFNGDPKIQSYCDFISSFNRLFRLSFGLTNERASSEVYLNRKEGRSSQKNGQQRNFQVWVMYGNSPCYYSTNTWTHCAALLAKPARSQGGSRGWTLPFISCERHLKTYSPGSACQENVHFCHA